MRARRAGAVGLLAGLALSPTADAGDIRVEGLGWVRGIAAEGQPSWLEGGYGRLTEAAAAPGETEGHARAQAQLGMDWRPSAEFLVHVHALARAEGSSDRGDRVGVTEAFLQFRRELSQSTAIRFRAGTFFPQTSRENVDPLWSSPYTLTLSALNTWIGEEVRLTGLEGLVSLKSAGGSELQAGAAAFGVADTMGALLAWRGWSFGDRLTTLAETLPLPPLTTLEPGGAFGRQQPAGTQPMDELDQRLGWQARARWTRPGSFLLQGAYLDNGGDRGLYHGQYSWQTRFGQIGAEVHLGRSLVLLGEGAVGETGMGPPQAAHVDVRFHVGYLLLSWGGERARVSIRHDRFKNEDRDGTAEPDGESGYAWTVAALWRPHPHVRLGIELLAVRADRPAAAFSGANPDTDASHVMGEVRLTF